MPFTEEQEQQILTSIQSMNTFFEQQKANAEAKEQKKEDPSILEEAKKSYENKQIQQTEHGNMENAIKFNLQLSKFTEDFKDYLPKTTQTLIEEVEKKNYGSEVQRANAIRSGIIQAFIELQENIEILPQTMKDKVSLFKALTVDEQEKQSASFWDVVEVGTTSRQLRGRAEALQKANRTGTNGGDNEHRSRFLGLGDKWNRKE